MSTIATETIHASTVAIGARAVLIEGPSGAGKSDLALRLIDRGAILVSDDYTRLVRDGDSLRASAPPNIAGKIEVRGLGVLTVPHRDDVAVALAIRLADLVERLPEPGTRRIAGIALREVAIDPREASAAIKVELALERIPALTP